MKTAHLQNLELKSRIERAAPGVTLAQAETLRRAQMTLHRWAELKCGDSNDYKSWAIERDETTGKPYMVEHMHVSARPGGSLYSNNRTYRTRIPDREHGALKRVQAVCASLGLSFYHQTDPRGCALYVGHDLTDSTYTRGVACCV